MTFKDSFQRSLLVSFFFICVFLGVTSFYYDYRTTRLEQNYLTKYYTILINIISTVSAPFVLYKAFLLIDKSAPNFLMKYSSVVNLIIRMLVIVYITSSRWKRDRQLHQLNVTLLRFEVEFPESVRNLPPKTDPKRKKIWLLIYLKLSVLIYQNLYAVSNIILWQSETDWQNVLLLISYFGNLNILLCTMNIYFLYLTWICKTYYGLNVRLTELLKEVSNDTAPLRPLLLQFRRLGSAHWHLSAIVEHLTRSYQIQILANIFTCVMTNVVTGYYGLMFTFILNLHPLSWYWWITSTTSYLSVFFDIYLLDVICDDIVLSYRETNFRLFHSCELPLREEVRKCREQFALQLSTRKFRIDICGFFNLDKRNCFIVIIAAIYYAIVLFQFDLILSDRT